MITNSESCEKLIFRVFNDFGVDYSDWTGRVPEWVHNALRELNQFTPLIDCAKDIEIDDFRGKVPCDIRILRALEFQKYRLPFQNQIGKYHKGQQGIDLPMHPRDTATIQPDRTVETSFQNGTITVHYKKLPTEYSHKFETDFPLYPDDEMTEQALTWYIFMMILGRGYKHPVYDIKYATFKWDTLRPKAKNSVIKLNAEDMELLHILWTNWIVNYNAWGNSFYNNHQ